MNVDFICYERKHEDWSLGREWVCHIQEVDGQKRSWHAERHVGNLNDRDERAKEEVIEEAYAKFHEALRLHSAMP